MNISQAELDAMLVAKSLRRSMRELDCDPAYVDAIRRVAENVSFDAWAANPRFDRDQFMGYVEGRES